MKNIILITICLTFLLISCNKDNKNEAQDSYTQMNIEELAIPTPFLEAVRSGDRNKIIKFFCYPLERPFPLPDIKNEQEMLEKFDMIFNAEVLKIIANSSAIEDWSKEAWRGICFKNEQIMYGGMAGIWMNYDGTIFRIPVSAEEQKLVEEFWEYDRKRLLPEFRDFDYCSELLKSSTYLLRVDSFDIEYGIHYNYRALFWEQKKSKTMSDKPDLILTNGKVYFIGNIGAVLYYFIDNNKMYIIEPPFYEEEGMLYIIENCTEFDPSFYSEQAKWKESITLTK